MPGDTEDAVRDFAAEVFRLKQRCTKLGQPSPEGNLGGQRSGVTGARHETILSRCHGVDPHSGRDTRYDCSYGTVPDMPRSAATAEELPRLRRDVLPWRRRPDGC